VPSQNCKLDKKLQLKLLVNTRHQFREHLASIFRKIDHLSLELVPINDLEYRQARASGNYDLLLIEFSGLISNFYLFAFLFQSQTSILSNGYKNTNYDRWTEKLSTAISVEERNQAIQEIESVIQSDPPALFLKQHDNVEWFKKSLKINSEGFFYRNFYSIKTRKDQTICPE
jgi:ABC-type oligopeptide transport system substrate-binding subunit